MKKHTISIFVIILLFTVPVFSQDFNATLEEASTSYNSGDLENARFALQRALQEINQAIGAEILGVLPENLGGMEKELDGDNVTGTNMGFAGLYVSRNYKGENRDASVQIVSDSPMLAGINALLTMPVFMASDPNQKRIKIDNYKALMTKNESEEGHISYDVQMPFGSSLLTFNCNGIAEEKEVTKMLDEIPVSEIVKMAQ